MTLVCLRTGSSKGWVTDSQVLFIHTRTGWAVTLCYEIHKKCEPEESEVDSITRGCLKVDYKDEEKRSVVVLEPREPGRRLYVGIMSDLF